MKQSADSKRFFSFAVSFFVVEQQTRKRKPANFREWLENVFGSGLMEVFLDPYNRKVWAYPPEELNVSWMGERVATVDFKKVLRNVGV